MRPRPTRIATAFLSASIAAVAFGCSSESSSSSDASTGDMVDDTNQDVPGGDADASQDATLPPECDGVTCNNGGSCVVVEAVGVCDCPAGTSGQTCETTCQAELLTPTSCTFDGTDCLGLFNDSSPVGFWGNCEQGDVPCLYDDGECAGGCVTFAIDIDLGVASWVPEVWWRSDWHVKRPSLVSVYSSDFPDFSPIRLVAALEGQENPWQCVTGEACGEEVPDECCPDGRDAPQRIEEGALISLWDIARFEGDSARYWRFEVEETYQRDWIDFQQMRFYGHDCPAGLGCDPRVEQCGDPAGGCDEEPCYEGVVCTDRPGQTPNFECGDCPEGFSGDGITCTEDSNAPVVVSTVPADGATIRFTAGAFNPGEVNRIVVTFDLFVFEAGLEEAPLTATAEHLDSDFSQALEVDPRPGPDTNLLRFVSAGTPLTAFPGGDYEVTIENVRGLNVDTNEFGTLDTYTWGFSTRACGDGTCDADESSCTCTDDCGNCAGCCRFDGGAPASVCRPGTANDECGSGGASCGVCVSPDVCVDGMGCL